MCSALQKRPDISLGIVTPRGQEQAATALTHGHAASRLLRLPLPERPLRYATTMASLINLDPWLGDAEWVYTPVEQPVTTSKPLAVTIHDVYMFERKEPARGRASSPGLSWRLRMRRVLDRADLIATVSSFTRSRIVELFGVQAPERIVVVGNGGAEDFSDIPVPEDDGVLHRHGLEPASYVLFPGSLTHRKGGDLVLKVAHESYTRGTGLSFVVIGRRHDRDLLATLDRMKAVQPGFPVILLGYVPTRDLAALYRHAWATYFPSRYEGFGIPVVEALRSGCPLFISPQPALVEVAAGRATVLDDDPLTVVDAFHSVRPNQAAAGVEDYTWARSASRLVEAMRAHLC
jgi:glycosyltransferase involved in cell wall biosynthesis